MPKRFTDTDKWKKPFIRGLDASYKLFWFYILDDCDHAGIWQVDFEVAQIRIGEKIIPAKAMVLLEDRIEIFDNGKKWFLKDFIFFQYGELTPKNRLHVSVINILTKHQVGPYKPLTRDQGTIQGQGQGEGIGQGQGEQSKLSKLEIFGALFSDDLFVEQLTRGHKGKNPEEAFEQCYTHHISGPSPPTEIWEWKQKLNTWLSIAKPDGKKHIKQNSNLTHSASLAEDFARRHGSG